MPPKKKKAPVNPVVVGTVSTRSTRRQSIVNIDIPKSNRTTKNNSKLVRGCVDEELERPTILNKLNSQLLADKIRKSYDKVFGSVPEMPHSRSTDVDPKHSHDIAAIGKASVKSVAKSNKALLQILQDWDDDDSQGDGTEVQESNSVLDPIHTRDKGYENLEFDADDISDIIGNSYKANEPSIASVNEENSVLEELEIEENCGFSKKVEKEMLMETDSSQNSTSTGDKEALEECLVEEGQEIVIGESVEVTYQDDEMGCIIEEIVPEKTEEIIISDYTQDINTPLYVEESHGDVNNSSTSPFEQKIDVCMQDSDDIKTVENVIVSEECQSVSTCDSNDAEVRIFFSKEIEKANADEKTSKIPQTIVVESENMSLSAGEINQSELFVCQGTDSIKDESINSCEEKKQDDGNELERDTQISLENYSNETSTLSVDGGNVRSENLEIGSEIMEIEEHLITETTTIEKEVEKLKIEDKPVESQLLTSDIDSRNVAKCDDGSEHIMNILSSNPEDIFLTQDLIDSSQKPKTRRIRTSQITEQFKKSSNISQPTIRPKEKVLNRNVENKSRERKNKEAKSKKVNLNPASKKIRNRTDVSKIEKKDKKEEKTDQDSLKKSSKTEIDIDDTEVRRSSRIKFINDLNKKTTGRGLVKSKSDTCLNECDISDSNSIHTESERSTPIASPKVIMKERKTRWTRSSENIAVAEYPSQSMLSSIQKKIDCQLETPCIDDVKQKIPAKDPVIESRLKQFVHLKENSYKTDRMTCKEAKKMTCDCFLTAEEIESNEFGCGEDCLNRLLLIECGNLCQVGDRCTNKRFQKGLFAPVEVFNTEKKGLGLRAAANIAYGEFILEYVGEVLNSHEFDKRAEVYSQDKNIHYYFMALRADAIIDATIKGNISRFINHSCDPNAETQKWTANGELRIGFFSTRTILAGEEITFDYRFQRYGKEAQKCYCGASICRGWLGEQPDSEDEEDEEEEDDEILNESLPDTARIESTPIKELPDLTVEPIQETADLKKVDLEKVSENKEAQVEEQVSIISTPAPATVKRKSQRKKPRIELFEEIDQLNEEIEMLVTTGLKNQAHTLKLSRLMVRAKEPQQRTKLLRVLRRGELPCRRLFLDYHGLRLMHGYMIDAQHLVKTNRRYESVRLEMLQTLAVLPIPNKTMLQDSKVLPTVEKWSTNKELTSPLDSDSNSPKIDQNIKIEKVKDEIDMVPKKEESVPERSIEDQEEEIKFLATKLLEEWRNLPEVFRIPKKERIEQMKEHEREANKKFMQSAQSAYGGDHDKERKSDRYRTSLSRYKGERETNRKPPKPGEKPSAEYLRLSKIERRKLFALQHELKEEERRLKQRELWRQHEMNCLIIGTDPRFTAPFDPSRGYQCIWNPQIGQWQNYPLPPNTTLYPSQPPQLPNLNVPPPHIPKSLPSFSYTSPLSVATNLGLGIAQLPLSGITGSIQLPAQTVGEMSTASSLHSMPQSISRLSQLSTSLPSTTMPLVQYQEQVNIKEEDPSQVKFMGPIPPPVKLPPKWKCAKDKYGRPYYYHVKIRKSQWEPPPYEEPAEENDSFESDSSSETSSVSSDTSSENSESDDDINDTKLLLEVRKQMENSSKVPPKSVIIDQIKMEESTDATPSPDDKVLGGVDLDEHLLKSGSFIDDEVKRPSIDMRLKELDLFKDDKPPKKKRRVGLCEEIIISPRTEEDKKQFKEDIKRYKANKEKLKRQKELILQQTKKQLREIELKKIKEKRPKTFLKVKIKDMPDFNSDAAKKIKETFRTNMASTVVSSLNAYRKTDCTEGRITNTDDFKHLARKLTHFVMLKEMKHISKIEELTCTDNVKMKAREYIRKYMSKFGEVYIKRNDSPDFKD